MVESTRVLTAKRCIKCQKVLNITKTYSAVHASSQLSVFVLHSHLVDSRDVRRTWHSLQETGLKLVLQCFEPSCSMIFKDAWIFQLQDTNTALLWLEVEELIQDTRKLLLIIEGSRLYLQNLQCWLRRTRSPSRKRRGTSLNRLEYV